MKTGELGWRNVLPEKQIFDDVAVCKRKVITASSSPSAHDTTIRAWTLDGELVWTEYRARGGNERCAVRCAESGDSADAVLVHCGKDIHVLSLAKGSSLRHIAAREGVTSVFVSSSEGWVYMLGSGGFEKVKLMAWDEKHEGALPEDAVVSESAAIVETEEGTTFAVFPSASSASDVHVISLSEDAGSAARVVAGVDVDTIAAAGSFVRIKTKSTGQFRYFSIDASTKALTAHAKPTGFGASDAFDESMLFTLEAKGADIQLSARAMGSDAKLTRRYRAKIGRTVDLLARGSVVTMLPRVSPSGAVYCLLAFEDMSVSMYYIKDKSTALWTREEALASITRTVSVAIDAAVTSADRLSADATFSERLSDQAASLVSTASRIAAGAISVAQGVLAGGFSTVTTVKKGERVVTDAQYHFGFHRLVIAQTSSGKLFAVRTDTAEVVWTYRSLDADYWMFKRSRGGSSYDVLLVYRSGKTVRIDAHTGNVSSTSTLSSSPLVHVVEMHLGDQRVVVALNAKHGVRSIPAVKVSSDDDSCDADGLSETARSKLQSGSVVVYTVDRAEGSLAGYTLKLLPGASRIAASQRWSFVFPSSERISAFAAPSSEHAINSAARVLGDKSILVKHLNPHMVAVAATAAAKGGGVTVVLIDVVTGHVAHRVIHRHGKGPVSMVRFENWLVYSYWNSKSKKTEVGVLTAYEGAIDKSELNPWTSRSPNATGSGESFSSYHATSQAAGAIIMERLYQMSTGVRTLGVTTTAKGITSKNVLFGLKSGQILSLDTRFLDPRRPAEKPTKEQQAEMLFQYHPNLPVVPQKVITYHKTVENLRHITSFPAKLESTSLIFAGGLDVFF